MPDHTSKQTCCKERHNSAAKGQFALHLILIVSTAISMCMCWHVLQHQSLCKTCAVEPKSCYAANRKVKAMLAVYSVPSDVKKSQMYLYVLMACTILQNEHEAYLVFKGMLQKLPKLTGPFAVTQNLFTALMQFAKTHEAALEHLKQVWCQTCSGLVDVYHCMACRRICNFKQSLMHCTSVLLLSIAMTASHWSEGDTVMAQVLLSVHRSHALFSAQ